MAIGMDCPAAEAADAAEKYFSWNFAVSGENRSVEQGENSMRHDKVQCQCCGKWMVPKVIVSAPFYMKGIPIGGRNPEGSVCPFCLSPAWMITESQAKSAVRAHAEFAVLMLIAIINIVIYLRLGPSFCAFSVTISLLCFWKLKNRSKNVS
jgi:hypothetical protein